MSIAAAGPLALVEIFEDGYNGVGPWQQSRTGRDDVPQLRTNPDAGQGIIVFANQQSVNVNHAVHDSIHIYHPEGAGAERQDDGYKEETVTETVQMDLAATDKAASDGTRSSAKERMVGYADQSVQSVLSQDPPYEGILGEVIYILEGVRRGMSIYTTVDYTILQTDLGKSNADVAVNVELEQLARNTRV
jgi:hypothetical protein